MSKQNFIEKLLQGAEVEWKPLGDVCIDFLVPMRDKPKVFDGNIPWCRIEDKEGQYFNKSLSGLCVSEELIKKMNLKVFPTGTVICSCSASIGAYAINTQPLITNQTFIGLVCGEKLFNKYLLYYMETQTGALQKLATTVNIPYISRKKAKNSNRIRQHEKILFHGQRKVGRIRIVFSVFLQFTHAFQTKERVLGEFACAI